MLERLLSALQSGLHLRELLSFWAIFDIGLLAVVIYQLLLLIRGTRAVQILIGVSILAVLRLATAPGLLPLPAIHWILGFLLIYMPFAIIVLFQNQIRQALSQVGRNPITALMPRRHRINLAEEVSLTAASLASKGVGCLIVLEREMGLRAFSETGIRLDAYPSYDLLMNIFTKDSPLHDGAAIIADGRIKAASCYLPLTTDPTLSRKYGTRHRAAIGITEESDALAVVVSEERGSIALAEHGRIIEGLDARGLTSRLRIGLATRADEEEENDTAVGTGIPARGESDA